MAEEGTKFFVGNNPETLYTQCLKYVVVNTNYSVTSMNRMQELRYLPLNILVDVYELMSRREYLKDALLEQMSDLEIFTRLLRHTLSRRKLHRIVSELMVSKKQLTARIRQQYVMRYKPPKCVKLVRTASKLSTLAKCKLQQHLQTESSTLQSEDSDNEQERDRTACNNIELPNEEDYLDDQDSTIDPIELGLRLGTFLAEAGWMADSIKVLRCLNARLKSVKDDLNVNLIRLDCLQRLLQAQSAHCDFKAAQRTLNEIHDVKQRIASPPPALLAITYTQISAMYFARNEYSNSHTWSSLAIPELRPSTPEKITIDVLRQAAKACVVKRDFPRANMLICQALRRARLYFGTKHQKYGDALLDYGFFLLNVDSIFQSVVVYKQALQVRQEIFGIRNFHVALAHEDLSYAYYVHEYSTGDFSCAQDHVDKAVDIMREIMPSNHLMLASAKRVKALLLEEIALDKMADGINEEGLLNQSEELHRFALQLSLDMFGEFNVQTAKHYGNLGRLYQTMNRYEQAELMHQRAIKIKTDILGPFDYEVGLSIGHLASLYNYQMRKYREAEDLYLRSIDISLRLFGRSYSGLEYDYLGLCHVYEAMHEIEKYLRYASILENWQLLRGQNITQNKSSYPPIDESATIEEIQCKFFNISANNATEEK